MTERMHRAMLTGNAHGQSHVRTNERTHSDPHSPTRDNSPFSTRTRAYGGFIDWPVDDPIPYELVDNS